MAGRVRRGGAQTLTTPQPHPTAVALPRFAQAKGRAWTIRERKPVLGPAARWGRVQRSSHRQSRIRPHTTALTPRQRLRLARLIVEENWPIARAAEWFQVSWPTAKRWADRYALAGPAGMTDRSSRPHPSPRRTPQPLVRKIAHLRCKRRLGPVAIAAHLGVAASTVYAVLAGAGSTGWPWWTGPPASRSSATNGTGPASWSTSMSRSWATSRPAAAGGSSAAQQGRRNQRVDGGKGRSRHHNVLMGHAYVHAAVDDHSRLAYAEVHDDETATTAIGFWRRAVAWYAARGITIERVLSDNGSCYRSRAWRQACTELGIAPVHPPLPATDQRQSGTLQPHPDQRVGVRPPLPQRSRPPRRPTRLPAHLQSPPPPHRPRRPATDQPVNQRVRAVHLAQLWAVSGRRDPPVPRPR